MKHSSHIIMHAKDRLTLRETALVLAALRNSPNALAMRGAIAKLQRCLEAAHAASDKAYLIGNTGGKRPRKPWTPKLTGDAA